MHIYCSCTFSFRFASLFDSCLSPIMLLYMFVCSVMLCVTAYQITVSFSIFLLIIWYNNINNKAFLFPKTLDFLKICWMPLAWTILLTNSHYLTRITHMAVTAETALSRLVQSWALFIGQFDIDRAEASSDWFVSRWS